MMQASPSGANASIQMIEFCATLVVVGISFCFPRLAAVQFGQLERVSSELARRKRLSVTVVGLAALLLRLALLPLFPIPLPFVPDDFSFLLAAETFAHGRLVNPAPAMWVHFETIHVTVRPGYGSMYFPGQGLVLAAGQVLLGHPWFGLLVVNALMCAAICWMLQAWMPAGWALLGGLIAVMHLGLFSYWINTYHAAGGICALGGALVVGALPRLKKTRRILYGMLLATGIALLALTRPYEGLLLCLPVAVSLGRWVLSLNAPVRTIVLQRAVAPLALVAASLVWLGYYDNRAFGSATTLPYALDRAEYAMAPYYVWQAQRPEPAYRHVSLRTFYHAGELEYYSKIHSVKGFVPQTLLKAGWTTAFYTGFALLPPLFWLPVAIRDRRMRELVICLAVMAVGMVIQIFLLPHYVAAFTPIFYALGLQAMRRMRQWRPEGKTVGLTMARMSAVLCLAMAALRVGAEPLHLMLSKWPATHWNLVWYGPGHYGVERSGIEEQLNRLPGKHLVLVRYSAKHNPFDEWVYNAAEMEGAKILWAREMDGGKDVELIDYYKDRQVWLVEPDRSPVALCVYRPPLETPDRLMAGNETGRSR